jgi:arylsulfatase A-like enzyme
VFVSVNVAAMVSRLDNSVGQIVGALMEMGMLKNSIIVFVSDNGAPSIGTYQNWGSNYPLRGVRVIYMLHRSDQDSPVGEQFLSLAP